MALAPSVPDPSQPYKRVKGDYVLMLLQCIVGVLAMLMPSFLRRRLRVIIPSKMMVLFALFLYCAIYLGEGARFLLSRASLGHHPSHLQRGHAGRLGFSSSIFSTRQTASP